MRALLTLFIITISLIAYGQGNLALSVFGGMAKSKFDLQGYSETTSIPVGVSFLYGRTFRFGIEASSNFASPYQYKAYESSTSGVLLYEQKIVQHDLSMVVLIDFAQDATVSPFLRGGAGGYFGKKEDIQAGSSEPTNVNFESAVGWHAGAGININLGYDERGVRLYAEGIYHSYSQEAEDNSLDFDAANWQVRCGFRFIL